MTQKDNTIGVKAAVRATYQKSENSHIEHWGSILTMYAKVEVTKTSTI